MKAIINKIEAILASESISNYNLAKILLNLPSGFTLLDASLDIFYRCEDTLLKNSSNIQILRILVLIKNKEIEC